jgi:transposase-like protein
MAASDLVNLSGLLDDAKCFALVRQHRWPTAVRCPGCESSAVTRDGHDDTQSHRQRTRCKACTGHLDDLTGTVLAGHHQPLRVWVLCLSFMGLNLSNRQIAAELGLCASDVQAMTEQLRSGLVARVVAVTLNGEVEVDEVYVVAGHKGQPEEVSKRGGLAGAAGWQERRAQHPSRKREWCWGTLEKDKPPILGLIQRGGQVVLPMLANVQQKTIRPIITSAVAPGTLIHTDEHGIYARLERWAMATRVSATGAGSRRLAGARARQMTTGGKPKLLGISKRGNVSLRRMLIHGARAALPTLSKGETPLGVWLRGLAARAHRNTVVMALVAKLARIISAMLRSGRGFEMQAAMVS